MAINYLIYESKILLKFKHIQDDFAFLVVQPYSRFYFPWFQSPTVNQGPKILTVQFQK